MTPVHAVAGVAVGAGLLGVLIGCSSDAANGSLDLAAPISVASTSGEAGSTQAGDPARRTTTAPTGTLFSGPDPVSIAYWWGKHPDFAPADLADRKLLFNQKGKGSQRFPGPDIRQYGQVQMIITCPQESEYLVRLQVLDGLSIASTEGASCGGPNLSVYSSPPLQVTDAKTEVEVQVPDETSYYVTVYGKAK